MGTSTSSFPIARGDIIRILGPARVEVVSGKILVAGATYGPRESFIIHRFRSYGMLVLEEGLIKVVLGEGAEFVRVPPSEEVVEKWLSVAEELLSDFLRAGRGKGMRVLIIGPVDSGKTSLTGFIANYFLERGFEPYVLEADIGQEDLAVPGTVALSKIRNKFIWLRELDSQHFRFVGCITPSKCGAEIIASVMDLISEVRGDSLLIINTDGWVNSAAAMLYKLELIRWIKPSHILVTDREIYELLRNSLRSCKIYYAEPPKNRAIRDREARKELRKEAYLKYFSKGSVRSVDLSEVNLIGSAIFGGRRIYIDELASLFPCIRDQGVKVLYASKFREDLNIILENYEQLKSLSECLASRRLEVRLKTFAAQDFVGCLIGLQGGEGGEMGVGKIMDIKFSKGSPHLSVLTPYKGPIKGLIAGQVKLKDDFQELLGVRRCYL